jgi:hypothetical protein
MRQAVIELGQYLVKHLGFVAPWDAIPRSSEAVPVARIRTTRCLRGNVYRALALTPYETQTIIDELRRSGPGTAVELTLPLDVPESVAVRTEREFARLRPLGVEVVIRRVDDGETAVSTGTPPPTARAVAELAVLMGRLLHELQSERALTAAHLTARHGTPTAHLEAQWRATDGVLGVWNALLIAHADLLPPLVSMHAEAVNSLVTQLDPMRSRALVRVREVAETVDYYTQLAHALLATVDGLVAVEAATTMTAHLAFLHAKEEAAAEQLEVAAAARQGLSHSVAAHVASRTAYLRTFATTASEPVLSEYRALMGEPDCCESFEYERHPEESADAEAWSRTLTTVFERFHDVESRSAETLLESAM